MRVRTYVEIEISVRKNTYVRDSELVSYGSQYKCS